MIGKKTGFVYAVFTASSVFGISFHGPKSKVGEKGRKAWDPFSPFQHFPRYGSQVRSFKKSCPLTVPFMVGRGWCVFPFRTSFPCFSAFADRGLSGCGFAAPPLTLSIPLSAGGFGSPFGVVRDQCTFTSASRGQVF